MKKRGGDPVEAEENHEGATRLYPWRWSTRPRPLIEADAAPGSYGFYEIGFFVRGRFKRKYCGRAAGTSLKSRLRKHWRSSHNKNIAKNREELWYRYKQLGSREEARYVEAVHLAALEKDYEWNDRQEWKQHWAIETD